MSLQREGENNEILYSDLRGTYYSTIPLDQKPEASKAALRHSKKTSSDQLRKNKHVAGSVWLHKQFRE